MKVSVIIPTKNRVDSLFQAINSVCNQTVHPDELIIIDDASDKDLEKNLFENISFKKIQYKYYKFDSPQGACAARNKGAELATGDILMLLDDDDTWEPNKIKNQIEIFSRNEEVGLVYSGRLVVSEENRNQILYEIQPKARGYLFPYILYKNLIGTTSSVAIRRNVFFDVGGFDPKFPAMQDYDLWIRCCKVTKVEHDGTLGVRYTVAADSKKQISGSQNKHLPAIKLLLSKYASDISNQGFINSRKIRSAFIFYVAKSSKRHSYLKTIPWILRSFIYYPNFKSLILLLPEGLISKIRIKKR